MKKIFVIIVLVIASIVLGIVSYELMWAEPGIGLFMFAAPLGCLFLAYEEYEELTARNDKRNR